MNNRTQYALILNIILCTANTYTMDAEHELQKIAAQENAQQLAQTPTEQSFLESTNKASDDYDITYAQQTKKQTLQAQITKRKWFNMLYGAATLAMMGADIANSYWDEKGLFTQVKSYSDLGPNNIYRPYSCECPNRTISCKIDTFDWCVQSFGSSALYGVNDGMTMYRIYSGFANLYGLYQVQQALNTLTPTEETKGTSGAWSYVQGVSSGIIGTIAGVAGVVNGISNYPRTVAVWGINAAVDAIGSFNWHQNKNACAELLNLASQAQGEDEENKTDEEQR